MLPFEWRRVARDSRRIENSRKSFWLFFRDCGGMPGYARWIWRANLGSRRLSSATMNLGPAGSICLSCGKSVAYSVCRSSALFVASRPR